MHYRHLPAHLKLELFLISQSTLLQEGGAGHGGWGCTLMLSCQIGAPIVGSAGSFAVVLYAGPLAITLDRMIIVSCKQNCLV